jgi:hypothetical protein
MENPMNEMHISFDAAQAEEYRLGVVVGEPAAPDGETRVTLDGGGRFAAEQTQAEGRPEAPAAQKAVAEAERVYGEIGAEEAAKLLYQATLFPWGRTFPNRLGIPDEAVVRWTLEGPRGERVTLKVWLGDAEREPALAPVVEGLRSHLRRLSDGRMYL